VPATEVADLDFDEPHSLLRTVVLRQREHVAAVEHQVKPLCFP
jgi:hypothetical protein